MRVLIAHNFYQIPGGEDYVFENEKKLLQQHGHEVLEYTRNNMDIANSGLIEYASLPLRAIWNWQTYSEITRIIREFKPDIAHFHNTLPLISPAAYSACADAGVPVVQSMHNWRLLCPSGGLYYKNQHCEACIGKLVPWPGIVRKCYRDSHFQSAVVGTMSAAHHLIGTWSKKISHYIVFSTYYQNKLIQAGFPKERISVKPHFLEDPGVGTRSRGDAFFAGRLCEEKGVPTLLKAWSQVSKGQLTVCGMGPCEEDVRIAASKGDSRIELRPFLEHSELLKTLQDAAFLVWPSVVMETFGMITLEAMACGVPIISSKIDTIEDLTIDGETGLHFEVGNSKDLAQKLTWAQEHPTEMAEMGRKARQRYLEKYTPQKNYMELLAIYEKTLAREEKAPTP